MALDGFARRQPKLGGPNGWHTNSAKTIGVVIY